MDHSMDLRTKPEEEDEPPLLNDSVMPYMTPSHFLTWKRWKLETPAWVLETYEALVLDRAQWDRPENRPYYENMVARFVNHSDWVFMRPALEKKAIIPQAVVPYSTPGYDPAFYEHEKKTLLLPAVDLKQFNLWGLDPERFIKDMLSTNPGRIKELSKAQIVHAAGKFAELRSPGAHLGLNKLSKKQFETIHGMAALAKHDEERRAIIFEDGFFERTAGTDPAAMKNELQRQRSGMFGRARRSEKEISQAEVERIKELAQGIPKQYLYQPGIATTDRSLQLLRAHPLPEPQRTSLASSSMALIVFLPSLEEQAASVAVTNFHILPTEREHELKWVKLELLPGFHPAVVIPFENGSVKDRALAQLQYSSRFNFLEEKGVQLNACTLREDVAQEPTFKLGSVPLKNLALLDESLRAFFWYKGYISNRDLITEQVRGLNKSKVVVRNNCCYAWVQKCTVVKAGNKDQEMPAEPVEM